MSAANLWLAAILLVYATLTLWYGPWRYHPSVDPSMDGAYYYEIARHVRDGDGLVTNVSLMQKAYETFPHPTSVYPLWPLLLGYTSRLIQLDIAAVLLPKFLMLGALGWAYAFGARLVPRDLLPNIAPGFNSGHVLVLMLAFHRELFRHAPFPYTEPLAYLLLFCGAFRLHHGWRNPGLRTGAEAGMLLGLAVLARSQMVIALAAAASSGILFLVRGPHRRKRALFLAGLLACSSALAAAHYVYIREFVLDPGIGSLFRFDQNRTNDLLHPVPMIVETNSLGEYIRDRLAGFVVAWTTWGKYSFNASFHGFQYALPAALLVGVTGSLRTRRTSLLPWLRREDAPQWVFLVLLAMGGYLSIHHVHKAVYFEWNFASRQALTCTFAFFLGLIALLLNGRRLVRTFGVVVLCGATFGGLRAASEAAEDARDPPTRPYRAKLASFLDAEREKYGELTVAMHGPHKMAATLPGVNFHSVVRNVTTVEELRLLVEKRNVFYLILPRRRRGAWDWRGSQRPLTDAFIQYRDIGGLSVFVPASRSVRHLDARPHASGTRRKEDDVPEAEEDDVPETEEEP